MFRKNLVLFIRKHKRKIAYIIVFFLILIGISFIAGIAVSTINQLTPLFSTSENEVIEDNGNVIYGDNIENDVYLSDEEVIKTFIKYCNEGNTKKAYDMISQDCKDALYETLDDFKELYYDQIFYVDKTYQMQSWISFSKVNTYKVKLITDMFDYGEYNDNQYIEEYYTIIEEESDKKISINKFVKGAELNKTAENNGLKVTIKSKEQYMDYEIYTIIVENNKKNKIALDSRDTTSAMYLLDDNDVKYSSYIHETLIDELIVDSESSKTIKLKFNKMYNPNIEIKSVEFTDVILNYDEKDQRSSLSIEL